MCCVGCGGKVQRDAPGALVAVDKDAVWGMRYDGGVLRHSH